MSIIERMADLLGPVVRPVQEDSEPRDKLDVRKLDMIERALLEGEDPLQLPQPGIPAAGSDREGLMAGAGSSAAHSRRAATIRSVNIDLERLRRQNMITPDAKRTLISEAFRRIKRRVLRNVTEQAPDTRPNLVMVTSSVPGEGKSFCAINLALSIALEKDHTAMLVDGDVVRPSLSRVLGVNAPQGLMDVLSGGIGLSQVLLRTNIEKLILLPAGTDQEHKTELLASGAMGRLLREMSDQYRDRIIIFDSPPLNAASEASVLSNQMGQVLVVVEAGKTTERALASALSRIESKNVVGLVLNKAEHAALFDGYDGYGYDAT